ncbi:hypothetical protein D7X33_24230 [Butyricicoccus sp. 1XD8-22]|nr:hypothetical protein D7X33_24230 [Butyricicoccus sp. 1XD8-22]
MGEEIHNNKLNEITISDNKFYYESDEDYDYLTSKDDTYNGVKIKLRFSKDVEKNKLANEGLKLFFSGI